MELSREVNHYRNGNEISLIQSTKGYIFVPDVLYKSSGIQHNTEKILRVAAGADTSDANVNQMYTVSQCKSDVQNDQKDTENCLKRFQQEYNYLMKKKSEIQSIKSSTKNTVIETISPTIYSKSIESSNGSLCSLDELSISNLTADLSSNDSTVGLLSVNNGSMSSSNVDLSQDFKLKENSLSKNVLENKYKKKEMPYKYNSYDDQYKNKHKQCNKEKIGCLHAEIIKKNAQKNRENENIQKHKRDYIDLYGMLDEFNNEIIKIKELLSDKDSNSFCYSNNSNNYNINRYSEMSAGEDFVDEEEYQPTQQKTLVMQMKHTQSTDHALYYSKSEIDTNHSNFKAVYNHNNNTDCTNNEQNTSYTMENLPQQELYERFYQIQSSDLKNESLNSTVHFFPWQNPNVCQCGTIYNDN